MQAATTAFGTQIAGNDLVVEHKIRVRLPIRRQNLILNPSVEYGLQSWAATALAGTITIGVSGAQWHGQGGRSLLVQWGTAASGQQLVVPATSPAYTWDVGTTYTFSAWVFVPAGAPAVQAIVQGVALVAGSTAIAGSGWQRVSVTFSCDSTSTFVALRTAGASTAGQTCNVDEVLLEVGATVGTYFDGDDLTALNLIENPSFEHMVMPEQWVPTGCTITRDRSWAINGDYCATLTPTVGTTGTWIDSGGGAGGNRSGMLPGRTYTASATVNVPTALAGGVLDLNACRIAILYYDSADSLWHTVASAPGPVTGGSARLAVTVTLPATVLDAFVRLYNGSANVAANLVQWDAVMLRADTVDVPYFGGRRLSDNSWTGTPGNSVSRLAVNPYPDVTLACESVQIIRSMTTDMPGGTRLISGTPAATATIKVSGLLDRTDESKTAAWMLNPYEPTSPLYRTADPIDADVEVQQGLITGSGEELVTTFVGSVDSVDSDTGEGSATLNCVDYRGKLRPTVTLPVVAYQSQYTASQPGLSATWPMDAILRLNGIHTSPQPRAYCLLYVSNHGSVWPEVVGSMSNTPPLILASSCFRDLQDPLTATFNADPGDYTSLMIEGPWGRQVCKDPILFNAPLLTANRPNLNASGTVFFEGWFMGDSANAPAGGGLIGLGVGNYGGVSMTMNWGWVQGDTIAVPQFILNRGSGSATKPLTGSTFSLDTWHHVAYLVQYTGSTTATVTVWVDGVASVTNLTGLPAAGSDPALTQGTIQMTGWMDSVQITTEPNAVPQRGFYATAYLDASRNALVCTADTTGQDPWNVLQLLGQGELGVAGFDEHGEFRFRNRDNIGAAGSVRTVTSTASLKGGPQFSQGKSTLANHVTIPVNSMDVNTGTNLYQATDVLSVPGRKSLSFLVNTPNPVLTPQNFDGGYVGSPLPAGFLVGRTVWRASKTPTGGTKVSTGITITTVAIGPTVLRVTIKNTNSFTVYMVSPSIETDLSAGTPFLYIGGAMAVPPVGNPQAESLWQPSIDSRGDVALQMSANVWVQELASAQVLTDDTVANLARPRPIIGTLSLVHDPRLQLTDRVTVVDANGSKMNDDVAISGLTSTDTDTDWGLAVEARAINNAGDWIMGVKGRSELGTSTYA